MNWFNHRREAKDGPSPEANDSEKKGGKGMPPQWGQLAAYFIVTLLLQEVSTGAENDLQVATALARQMVAVFGMSEAVGLAHCAQRQNSFLAREGDGYLQRDCSEQTASVIDHEVKQMLAAAYAEAKTILQQHRDQLKLVAEELLKRETLDAAALKRLLGQSLSITR